LIPELILTKNEIRRRWIFAQRLNSTEPFGSGPLATQHAIEHLGYVQIDTISVIERCHHHILFNRIPQYQTADLHFAQSESKSIFEYWTHALAYLPTRDYRYTMRDMAAMKKSPSNWYANVKKEEMQKVLRLIKKEGALSIRDIQDDQLVEKDHPWASRKPSKKALQFGFYTGLLTVSERVGMLKKYELSERHFQWETKPKAATEKETLAYLLERSLRAQQVVSLDSICHLENKATKLQMKKLIDAKVKKKELLAVKVEGGEKLPHWMQAEDYAQTCPPESELTHLLSPFDPLVIQRKRLQLVFDYDHRFEAYLPKEKRVFGYFALPVLMGNEIVAVLDLKTDRVAKKLRMQKWTWLKKQKSPERKKTIEAELHRFEKFQLSAVKNSSGE
jgi:uncharacterized protein YcaQ